MHYELIEAEKYTFKIYPSANYLEYIIKPGVTIETEDVLRGKKEIIRLFPGMKFFVLAECAEFFKLSREARKITSTREYADNTHCIAFYTRNFSVAMLAELYNKLNKPVVPTRMFNNREQAKEWLARQMKIYEGLQKNDMNKVLEKDPDNKKAAL